MWYILLNLEVEVHVRNVKKVCAAGMDTTSSDLDDIVDLTVHVYCPLAAADESYKRSIHSFAALSLPVCVRSFVSPVKL